MDLLDLFGDPSERVVADVTPPRRHHMNKDQSWDVLQGDCLEVMKTLGESSIDSVVTDPPYGIGFLGKDWDACVPGVPFWKEALRVAKPGAYILAFGGTRTYHRLAVAIEDAGWEIRDCLMWVYGCSMPKSLDVSKAIDKSDAPAWGNANKLRCTEWIRSTGISHSKINEVTRSCMGSHYLTSKTQPAVPSREHLELLRPHFNQEVPDWLEAMVDSRTVESENFKKREVVGTKTNLNGFWGQGDRTSEVVTTLPATEEAWAWHGWGTNVKPSLEPIAIARKPLIGSVAENILQFGTGALNIDGCRVDLDDDQGMRWPTNLIHDGSEEVLRSFSPREKSKYFNVCPWDAEEEVSRFHYSAKASRGDRDEGTHKNHHPTVKPQSLMRHLCRLVTPPGGRVLDPFCGSGSTGKAAVQEKFSFIGIEREAEYVEIARSRIDHAAQMIR